MQIRIPKGGPGIARVSVVFALVVAGCGSSSQANSPAAAASAGGPTTAPSTAPSTVATTAGAAPDACSLLTKAEVEAATGHPVEDGVPDVVNSCTWEKNDPTMITVGLHLLGLPEGAKCAVGSQGSSPIEGHSVPASWSFIEAATTGSVVACLGGWQVQVTLVGDLVSHTTTEATLRGAGVQLMGLVLGRM